VGGRREVDRGLRLAALTTSRGVGGHPGPGVLARDVLGAVRHGQQDQALGEGDGATG
jgi:hypothetical protein